MPKKPSVIDINGNRYDAITGQLIKGTKKASPHSIEPSTKPVIDGFRRRPRTAPVFNKVAASFSPLKPGLASAKKHLIKPAQTVHSRTQRPKTLMRELVSKPDALKREPSKFRTPKLRTRIVNPVRFSKAMNTAKNATVSRFGNPIKSATPGQTHQANHPKRAISGELVNSRMGPENAAAATQQLPSMVASVSHQRLERMLDEALIRADAHKKALTGRLSANKGLWQRIKRLPTWLVVSLTVLIILLAGGFLAWRNIPFFSMKVASMRSQIKGSIPSYVPAGFKFAGPIKYQNGSLTMTYHADGSQSFQITQKASNWDSASLEANAVPHNSQMQTSQIKGTTVYIYGDDNNATWVNNGICYTIRDKAQLNSDQLLKIADGL